jgi:putative transposase
MAKRGRPPVKVVLAKEEREQLEAYSRSRSIPNGLSTRFKIILYAADGLSNMEISEKVGLPRASVGKWRKRFAEIGIQGLHDEVRLGRPRSVSDGKNS